jgi:hypothetical protein
MVKQKYKIVSAGLAALALSPLVSGAPVMAWGPERPTYTNQKPADHATFNSITNNAAVGDERDFVRIEEKNSGRPYSSEIILEAGKQYEVYIYYHNDASETYNDEAHGYAGVARDVRLSSSFPESLAANERAAVTGKITSSNAQPAAVWDEAYVTAKEAVTLHYVTGSAKIYNQWGVNSSTLATALFSAEGVPLGLNELNGVILGCDRYSGQIVYTIQTKAVEEGGDPDPDPEPTPDPDPEDPDPGPTNPTKPAEPITPEELPTTGPAEVALAVVVVLALAAGGFYWYRTHKAVKKATTKARGRK